MLPRIHVGLNPPAGNNGNTNEDTASSRKTSGSNSNSISVASLANNSTSNSNGNNTNANTTAGSVNTTPDNASGSTATARPVALALLPFDKHGINVDGAAYLSGSASASKAGTGGGAGGSQRSSLIAGLFGSLGGVLEDSTHPSPHQRRLVPPAASTDWNVSYQSSAVNRSMHPTSLLPGPTHSDFSALWRDSNLPLPHSQAAPVAGAQHQDDKKQQTTLGSIPSSPRKSSSNLMSLGLVSPPSTQPLGIGVSGLASNLASHSQQQHQASNVANVVPVQVPVPLSVTVPLSIPASPPISLPVPPPPVPAAAISPALPISITNHNPNITNNPNIQQQQTQIQNNPVASQYMVSPNVSSSRAAPMLGLATRSGVLPFVMASGMFDYGLGSAHHQSSASAGIGGIGNIGAMQHPQAHTMAPATDKNALPQQYSNNHGHGAVPSFSYNNSVPAAQVPIPTHSMAMAGAAANALPPSSIGLGQPNVHPLNAVRNNVNVNTNNFSSVAGAPSNLNVMSSINTSSALPVPLAGNSISGITAGLANDTRSTMSLDPIPPSSLVANTMAQQKEEPLFAPIPNGNRGRKRPRSSSGSAALDDDAAGNNLEKEQCPLCSEKFRSRIILQTHLRVVHKSGSEHRCEECNAEFPWKSTLDNHVRLVHRKERPFKCNRCEKAFRWSSHLEEHIWVVHEGRKPFKCEICDKAFGRKNNMQKHARKVHKLENSR